jgi:hypothetical protein
MAGAAENALCGPPLNQTLTLNGEILA